MKYVYMFLSILLMAGSLTAQKADITIKTENYASDTLLLGYYMADKILVKDTLYRNNKSLFSYKQDSLIESGMYLLVAVPSSGYYQVLINDKDQEFEVVVDFHKENGIRFTGSEENEAFYKYLAYLAENKRQLDNLDATLADTDSLLVSVRDQLFKDKQQMDRDLIQTQQQVMRKFQKSLLTSLLKSNLPFKFPEFSGDDKQIELQRYYYYREHYLDQVDLGYGPLLRTPVLHQRVNYYLENLTPRVPDSINQALDYLLKKMEPNPETYRYYLSYFLNTYGNSKYIGMDAVYVHLALEYYAKGKAPWVPEENLSEIVDNAIKIEPTLIGKPAPDFTIYQQDGSPISLSEIKDDYVMLVFWRPDCGHCTKAMPFVLDFNEKYKDKGVKVISVCTKTGTEFESCWESAEEKNMGTLINGGDQYNRSRIFSKYHAVTTPMIYIIGKDRKIRLKKVPAENLDAVMEEIMRIDNEQSATMTH